MGITGSKEAVHDPFQYNSTNSSPEANELLYNKLVAALFGEVPLVESNAETGFNEAIHALLTDNASVPPLEDKPVCVQNDLKTFNYRKLASHIVFILNNLDLSDPSVLTFNTYSRLFCTTNDTPSLFSSVSRNYKKSTRLCPSSKRRQ